MNQDNFLIIAVSSYRFNYCTFLFDWLKFPGLESSDNGHF